jgi:hypothetical protein
MVADYSAGMSLEETHEEGHVEAAADDDRSSKPHVQEEKILLGDCQET